MMGVEVLEDTCEPFSSPPRFWLLPVGQQALWVGPAAGASIQGHSSVLGPLSTEEITHVLLLREQRLLSDRDTQKAAS